METRPGRLLIVGHDDTHREILSRHLAESGYTVAIARDGRQGLDTIEAQKPDLVLLDVHTPKLDAYQVLESLKADEALRDIPVIVFAPADEGEAIERCFAMGAEDYLIKPFSPALLKAQVRDYLEVRKRRQEERDRLKREELLKIERDVQIACQIQANFLPSELPQLEGWEVAACFYPAREVAGDFYDAFTLTQGRRVGLVIADVCDKGVGAALFMALVRSLTRAFAQQHYSLNLMDAISSGQPAAQGRRRDLPSIGTTALKNAVVLTNAYITTNHMELNMFATLFFGMLDPATGTLAYINGGHNPPFIVGQNGEIKTRLQPTGPAVGIVPNADFKIGQASLDPGDILMAYTDGVTDARDPGGQRFTEKRFLSLLEQPVSSATALLDRIDTHLRAHTADAVQFDDITMMAVRRIPQPKASRKT